MFAIRISPINKTCAIRRKIKRQVFEQLLGAMAFLLILSGNTYAGTNFTEVAEKTTFIDLDKAVRVIHEAKISSQKVLSKYEIEKIKEQADSVLNSEGAMVVCSSQVIN